MYFCYQFSNCGTPGQIFVIAVTLFQICGNYFKRLTRQRIRYGDVYFRLATAFLSALFIVAYGEKESIFELLLIPAFYVSVALSFVISLILVNAVYFATIRLDWRYDWNDFPVQRTALQVLFAFLFPAVLAYLLAVLYFLLYGIRITDTPYLRFDYPIILIMLGTLNLYYLTLYFYRQSRIGTAKREGVAYPDANGQMAANLNAQEPQSPHQKVFPVSKGKSHLALPVESICYCYREGDYNFVQTFEEERFLTPQALDEIQESIGDNNFFRANRQFLVNRKACTRYQPLEHGKLQLFTHPSYKQPVIISQRRAKSFREWIHPGTGSIYTS